MPDQFEQLLRGLNEALAQDQVAGVPASEPGAQAGMALPPGLLEEVARLFCEFWERHRASESGGRHQPLRWEQIPPRYQMAWLKVSRIALEMTIKVVLGEAHHYLDQSNGDMGAAFARALRRYSEHVLNLKIGPS